jgi:hypothetical protein
MGKPGPSEKTEGTLDGKGEIYSGNGTTEGGID